MLTFKTLGVLYAHNATTRSRAVVKELEKEGLRVVEIHEAIVSYSTFGEEQHILNQEDVTHIVSAQFVFGKVVRPVTSIFAVKARKKRQPKTTSKQGDRKPAKKNS